MSLADRNARNQRLVILRALSKENDGRMNETLLGHQLELFGHTLSRGQIRDQLRWLEGVDAVRIELVGEAIMVAELTQRGQDHVDRRGEPIDGIDLPSRV